MYFHISTNKICFIVLKYIKFFVNYFLFLNICFVTHNKILKIIFEHKFSYNYTYNIFCSSRTFELYLQHSN